ncbi:TerC family protein [Sporomusa acidovorans]|uniref:Integral membrane protein TerC family protein n=1 Tax=Sporomusa acidovorans (strain ATCC 49682 / DSM 3132 / Mol) TaxID=1123286 RepID=A0ABZ3J2V4_SPOA4|nr:TerC family protein [Sporomusa acidovorans]OZC24334.1 integral membrane protein TerC family protein [Sporomusa acidovorans DSM 3132]SDF76661.1 integral membrane protein, YjbE family [Sporomusa acidovorans]
MNFIGFGTEWFVALGSILFMNLILSGDNAVIIALASKNLSSEQRKTAILWGSAGAVILRIVLTFVAAYLLNIPYFQLAGGIALLWIAISLLNANEEGNNYEEAISLKEAIKVILLADLVMSLDNVLALAAISQTVSTGKYALIIVGLATSIPLVIFGAQILMKLMDRFPLIVYLGAGILGYAAAEMIIGDKAVSFLTKGYEGLIEIGLSVGVVVVGFLLQARNSAKG